MRHHKTLLACIVSLTLGVATASAKAKKTKPVDVPPPEAMIEQKFLYDGDDDFKSARARLVRSIATERPDLCPKNSAAKTDVTIKAIEAEIQKTQPGFVRLRDEVIGNSSKNILGIKSKNQVDEFINKYSARKEYEALDPAARMIVLQMRSLAVMKSFFFRAKEYIRKNSITRTTIVSMLRAQAVGIQNFTQTAWGSQGLFAKVQSPDTQIWEAAFNYMTEPMPNMGPKIQSDEGLELFLSQLLNQAISISNDFHAILLDVAISQTPIWWDNKLYLGFANFVDPKDRYVKLGVAELFAIQSGLSLGVSSLQATTSYSFKGFLNTIESVGKLMGYDLAHVTDKNGAEGLTAKNRFSVLAGEKALFTATADAGTRMAKAYFSLREAVYSANDAYTCLMKRNAEDQMLFDARMAQSMNRIALNSLGNLVTLFESKKVNSTVISGESIDVNLWGFYANPPKQLAALYPIKFNDESNNTIAGSVEKIPEWGNEMEKVRNYKYESARAWYGAEYKKLFPNINVDKNGETTEVGKYARILSQTWGSAAFAIPLSAFVF